MGLGTKLILWLIFEIVDWRHWDGNWILGESLERASHQNCQKNQSTEKTEGQKNRHFTSTSIIQIKTFMFKTIGFFYLIKPILIKSPEIVYISLTDGIAQQSHFKFTFLGSFMHLFDYYISLDSWWNYPKIQKHG